MPNDREKIRRGKNRRPDEQDRRRNAATRLDNQPRSRAFVQILPEAIALAADRGGIRQFSPIPTTYRFPTPYSLKIKCLVSTVHPKRSSASLKKSGITTKAESLPTRKSEHMQG